MKLLKCELCSFKGRSLISHVKHAHKIKPSVYKNTYNVETLQLYSRSQIATWNQVHSSVLTKKYWMKHGLTELESINRISDIQRNNSAQRKLKYGRVLSKQASLLNVEHWIAKGLTMDESIQKISEIQSCRSKKSKKFEGKHHSLIAKAVISNKMKAHAKQNEWFKHFGDFSISFRSKNEIKLFDKIKLKYADARANEFIAGYNVDVFIPSKNIIVEYFGDYWHMNPKKYSESDINSNKQQTAKDIWEYDSNRISDLELNGYTVMIIWESDFRKVDDVICKL